MANVIYLKDIKAQKERDYHRYYNKCRLEEIKIRVLESKTDVMIDWYWHRRELIDERTV